MENLNLREHIDYVIQCTKDLGLSQSTIDRYVRHYEEVFLYCTKNEIETFSYQDAADFCNLKYGTDFQNSRARPARKAAYTVARYFDIGEFDWSSVTFITRNPESAEYKELIRVFKQELSKKLSPGTVRPEIIIIRQFLYFLEQAGVWDAF